MKKACEEGDTNKVQELLQKSPALLEVSLDEVFLLFFFNFFFKNFLFFFVVFVFVFGSRVEDSLFLTFGFLLV